MLSPAHHEDPLSLIGGWSNHSLYLHRAGLLKWCNHDCTAATQREDRETDREGPLRRRWFQLKPLRWPVELLMGHSFTRRTFPNSFWWIFNSFFFSCRLKLCSEGEEKTTFNTVQTLKLCRVRMYTSIPPSPLSPALFAASRIRRQVSPSFTWYGHPGHRKYVRAPRVAPESNRKSYLLLSLLWFTVPLAFCARLHGYLLIVWCSSLTADTSKSSHILWHFWVVGYIWGFVFGLFSSCLYFSVWQEAWPASPPPVSTLQPSTPAAESHLVLVGTHQPLQLFSSPSTVILSCSVFLLHFTQSVFCRSSFLLFERQVIFLDAPVSCHFIFFFFFLPYH